MRNSGVAPTFIGAGRIQWGVREYREPGPGELVVRIRANAICGTDRTAYFSGSEVIPGHEAAGEVVGVGRDTSILVGTRGVVYFKDFCGRCRNCAIGATNQCLAKRADMGFTEDGGYGPYEVVHETNFFPVGDQLTYVEATLLLDTMGTTGHALDRAEMVRSDINRVYIAGAGPIGLGLLVMANLRYGDAVAVYISDVSPWRLGFAEDLGGIAVDARDVSAVSKIGKLDVCFDASGKKEARQAAFEALGSRGVLVCVGGSEGLVLDDVGRELLACERSIVGSEYFNFGELGDNLRVLLANREGIGRLITHTYTLSDLEDAFEVFLSGETGKVVVMQEE